MRRPDAVIVVAAVVAFAACSSDGGYGDTASRSAGGGEPSNDSAAVPPELARRQLVFTREDGTYVARADGSQMRRLLDFEGVFEFQADVSPDGTRLLLRVDDPGAMQGTWIVGADGRRPRHLSGPQKPVSGGAADWAPDGKRFVVAGKRANERFFGLYVLTEEGRSFRRITPDAWEAQYPAWSPDGRRIAFTRVTRPNGHLVAGGEPFDARRFPGWDSSVKRSGAPCERVGVDVKFGRPEQRDP